jgi:hypothetical protein
MLIDFRVTLFTSLRPDIVRRSGSLDLLNPLLLRWAPKTANVKDDFQLSSVSV